jgi:hypothetical protein
MDVQCLDEHAVESFDELTRHQKIALLVHVFMEMGIKREVAIGAVSSLIAESKLDSKIKNPNSSATGLAQWMVQDHGDRGGRRFTKITGVKIEKSTGAQQLKYMLWELRGPEKGSLLKLQAADSAWQGAEIWTMDFERPAKKGTKAGEVEIKKHAMFIKEVRAVADAMKDCKMPTVDTKGFTISEEDYWEKRQEIKNEWEWVIRGTCVLGGIGLGAWFCRGRKEVKSTSGVYVVGKTKFVIEEGLVKSLEEVE